MKRTILLLFFIIITITSGCVKNNNNLGEGYFSYENKIYYNSLGNEVIGADIKTFVILYKDNNCGDIKIFAKDKKNVYGEDMLLFTGFDYNTLTGEENCIGGCFKDKSAAYYHDNSPELKYKKDITRQFPQELIINQNVLPTGAIALGGGYFEYEEKIYINSTGVEVEKSDIKTFEFLYKDGLCGDGPHTFAKDKNNVYGDFRVLFSGFDYDTLKEEKNCARGCFKDKDASYYFDGCDENGCLYIKDNSFSYPIKK